MRCHARRVNATVVAAPLLATAFRPIPLVVVGYLAAMWFVAFTWWAFQEMSGPAIAPNPAYLYLVEMPVAQAGYWWHIILGGLLLADRYLARADPPGQRWTRRGTWAIAAFAVFVSLWNYTIVHRHAQTATREWYRYPEYLQRGVNGVQSELRRGRNAAEEFDWLERALALRPGEPEVHDWIAWFLLSHPDPKLRDLERARHHADEADRIIEAQYTGYSTNEGFCRHQEVLAALAALQGDVEQAMEHLEWIVPRLVWDDGSPMDEDVYEEILKDRGVTEQQQRRARLLLEARPWELWQ